MLSYSDVRGAIDFGILTVRADEYKALLDHFPDRQTVKGRAYYEYSQVDIAGGDRVGVAVARCLEQGQGPAGDAARDLIEDLDPGWILLVGIAGGVPDDDYSLGDVLLANRVYDFSVHAVIEDQQGAHSREWSLAGGPVHSEVASVLAAIPGWQDKLNGWNNSKAIGMKKPGCEVPPDLSSGGYYGPTEYRKKVQDSLRRHFPLGKTPRRPCYAVIPVGTGNALVKDQSLLAEWKHSARALGFVEMEAGGVYRAARRQEREYPVLVVRGLSDIVGFKRAPAWTEYACRSAAAFTAFFVRCGAVEARQTRGPESVQGATQQRRTGGHIIVADKPSGIWSVVVRLFRRYAANDKPVLSAFRAWTLLPGRRSLLLAFLLWIVLVAYRESDAGNPISPAVNRETLGHLLHNTLWMHYDPSGMTLDSQGVARYPDLSSIERDLDIIAQLGFQGIVTSGSEGNMVFVPKLAKARNLKVIMGVFDASKRYEVSRAIREHEYVDAYCIGHNGIDVYSEQTLRRAISFTKSRTGKPVSTTEPIVRYTDSLASLGDWLFPDSHLSLRRSLNAIGTADEYSVDIRRDVRSFLTQVKQIASWARQSDRPLVLKNVAYPHSGIPGASLLRQREFFHELRETLRDPQSGLQVAFAIVPQTAFDCPWKANMKGSYPWDAYTGLLSLSPWEGWPVAQVDKQASLRPAAEVILSWHSSPSKVRKQ